MKRNSFLTRVFVSEKRAQRVNAFLTAGGHESKVEVVAVSDLFMESAFSKG
jgi:hypothetical protein